MIEQGAPLKMSWQGRNQPGGGARLPPVHKVVGRDLVCCLFRGTGMRASVCECMAASRWQRQHGMLGCRSWMVRFDYRI